MTHRIPVKALALIGSLSVMLLSAGASGQTFDLPYQGWLDKDGQPCSGEFDMKFWFYNEDDTLAMSNPVEIQAVPVSTGTFSVVLTLPDYLAKSRQKLFLGVEVKGAGDADYVPLINRQRILPSLYAVRNAPSLPAFYVKASDTSGLAIGDGWLNYADPDSTDRSGIFNDPDGGAGVGKSLVIAGNRAANPGYNEPGNVTILHNLRVYSALRTGDTATLNSLKVGSTGTLIKRIEVGVVGNCETDNAGEGSTVSFSSAFTDPPVVILTPREADNVGCTSVRVYETTTTAFSWRSWAADEGWDQSRACDCINWMAIGR